VPEDLAQVVTTTDAPSFSTAVLADPRVRKVSFTGSTAVGKVLLRLAADNVLKSSEAGGLLYVAQPVVQECAVDLEGLRRARDGPGVFEEAPQCVHQALATGSVQWRPQR
jgi:hypothetical protein